MITDLLTYFIGPIGFTTLIIGAIIVMVAPSIGTIVASTWSTFLEFIKPMLVAASEGVVELLKFLVKSFVEGVKVCLSNLSTLTVLVVAIVVSGWYFQTWNDKRVIKPYEEKLTVSQLELKTCKAKLPKTRGR